MGEGKVGGKEEGAVLDGEKELWVTAPEHLTLQQLASTVCHADLERQPCVCVCHLADLSVPTDPARQCPVIDESWHLAEAVILTDTHLKFIRIQEQTATERGQS